MKGLIITNAYAKSEEYYNQPERLREELLKNGVFTDILPLDTSMCGISARGESIFNLKDYDFCVFYDKDPYAIQLIEKSGLRCFNTYEAMSACDDKMLTAIKLANFGIPMPETYFSPLCYVSSASVSTEDISFLSDRLGYPMIVKECYGSLGKGVHLIRNENELKEIAEKLKFMPHLYQKYISESFGTDIRAIVVGGKFAGAMKRISGGDFRSNIASGGHGEIYTADNSLITLSEKIARVLKLDYCGIDFLLASDGYVLCEVNSNAFFREFEKVTKINVAELYAKHIVSSL